MCADFDVMVDLIQGMRVEVEYGGSDSGDKISSRRRRISRIQMMLGIKDVGRGS